MRIGVPTEIKSQECRVAITSAGVHQLVQRGHEVIVQKGAGIGSALSDEEFIQAGAILKESAADVWGDAELVLKVKEPIPSEYQYLRPDLTLFTYLHLAADQPLTEAVVNSGVTSIAYETVQTDGGALPLLIPMSEVAGRLSTMVGAQALMKHHGGDGVLLPGVPGVMPGKVVVIGAGTAGHNAAQIAFGLRADVTILDVNAQRLAEIDVEFDGRVKTLMSTPYSIERAIRDADLVIGSVLVPGARAPKLVSNAMVAGAKPGSVFVDIAVDQGGCFEDTHATTHGDPTYPVHNSVFYAVANMPGAVPVTSTYALTNATLPYVNKLGKLGWKEALRADRVLARGLSSAGGHLTSEPVAVAWEMPFTPIDAALSA